MKDATREARRVTPVGHHQVAGLHDAVGHPALATIHMLLPNLGQPRLVQLAALGRRRSLRRTRQEQPCARDGTLQGPFELLSIGIAVEAEPEERVPTRA